MDDNDFGKALIAKGLSWHSIMQGTANVLVTVMGENQPGTTRSNIDTMKDLHSDTILSEVDKIGIFKKRAVVAKQQQQPQWH